MPGARTIEDVGHAQWNAHLNNAVRQALRQTLSERPLDPIAHIGRLLTANETEAPIDGPAPPPLPSALQHASGNMHGDSLRRTARCDEETRTSAHSYEATWFPHVHARVTEAMKETDAQRPDDPVMYMGRLLLATPSLGSVTALDAGIEAGIAHLAAAKAEAAASRAQLAAARAEAAASKAEAEAKAQAKALPPPPLTNEVTFTVTSSAATVCSCILTVSFALAPRPSRGAPYIPCAGPHEERGRCHH